MPKPTSRADLTRALRAINATGGNTTLAARQLGISRTTLQSRLEQAQRLGVTVPAGPDKEARTNAQLTQENAKLKAEVERLKAARKVTWKPGPAVKPETKDDTVTMIMPDSHGMYADHQALSLFVQDVKSVQPDHIIGLGDHLDCGGFLAQHHVLGYVAQLGYSYEQDLAACAAHLDAIQKAAPSANIELLEGNHEERVEKWCVQQTLGHAADADALRKLYAPQYRLHLEERGIRYYRRSETYDGIGTPGVIHRGNVFYVHDGAGGSDPARAHLTKFGGNVVFGHIHRMMSVTGQMVATKEIGAWSFGCLSVKQPLWQHSRCTTWTHGYGLKLTNRSGKFLMLSIPLIGGESYLKRVSMKIAGVA
jgi:cell division protein FtsB